MEQVSIQQSESEEAAVGDLLEILGKVSLVDYCGSSGRYRDWERNTAEPRLKELGYEVKRWVTTDGDSFGPLCREVTCIKDDATCRFCYG